MEWLHSTALPDRSLFTHLLAGVIKGSGSGLLRPFIVGNENLKSRLELQRMDT